MRQCDRRICDPGGGGKASAGKTGVFFCKMAAECGADDRRRRGPVRGDRPWKDPDRLCKKDQRDVKAVNIEKLDDLEKLKEL